MYKLIIVDDEPLIQIGMKTMIDYRALDIEVVGVASNGKIAMDMIEDMKPHIVITDIKMPVMDGLKLVEKCNDELTHPPLFIVLTSFEEFEYVRQAMRSNVIDYIIKMELTPDVLEKVLKKTIEVLKKAEISTKSDQHSNNIFINRFLNKLLNNVFSSEQEINEKLYAFNLDFSGDKYLVAISEIDISVFESLDYKESYNLYIEITNMAKIIISKYVKNYVVACSQTTFGVIMCFESDDDILKICNQALNHVAKLCMNYFNVCLRFGVGQEVESLMRLSTSFYSAQNSLLYNCDPDTTVQFYDAMCYSPNNSTIDVMEVNQEIIKALETYNLELFSKTIESLIYNINYEVTALEEAINIISGIVHLIINNLDNGEEILYGAFSESPKSYLGVYNCTNKKELIYYLRQLCNCIVEKLDEQRKNPKNKLVIMAQNYIKDNIYKKLTLNEVAQAINISPNYLSSLFKKYSTHGFNDYVTILKIRKAQQLLAETNLKVYEVSEKLGFSSPYYFSTVYKKITGLSPTESTTRLLE